tara:strand:+ start:2146 stop:2571 length:426 start_codon:yes stop_codon:yes gene_type:complete
MSVNLRNLIQHFSESDYGQFEVSAGAQSISLKRRKVLKSNGAKEIENNQPGIKSEVSETNKLTSEVIKIKANRVGQFFPKVSVGDKVAIGQVLGFIKAMNIMNELRSTHVGVVRRLVAQHQEGVAFDELLLELSEDSNEID